MLVAVVAAVVVVVVVLVVVVVCLGVWWLCSSHAIKSHHNNTLMHTLKTLRVFFSWISVVNQFEEILGQILQILIETAPNCRVDSIAEFS